MYAAIIEWPEDMAEAPSLHLSADVNAVLAGAVEELACREVYSTDAPDFYDENPAPDLTDPTAVREWLLAMREATTQPWVTFYEQGPAGTRAVDLSLRAECGDPSVFTAA